MSMRKFVAGHDDLLETDSCANGVHGRAQPQAGNHRGLAEFSRAGLDIQWQQYWVKLLLGIQMKTDTESIPVIDLFAGPGGLCEGFSSLFDETGARRFDIRVSIEKDPVAHSTLMLRAIFRRFPKGKAPDAYYDYVRGSMSRAEFLYHPDIRDAAKHAANEARCAELGKTPPEQIDAWIGSAVNGASDWVLIGGPPCQAYSLAGRSRLRPKDREAFEADSKHFLYTEYLRIIQRFEPTVFVMENVKGMLNSRNSGARIFECILADLSKPKQGLSYRIRSLAVDKEELEPEDFVVEADAGLGSSDGTPSPNVSRRRRAHPGSRRPSCPPSRSGPGLPR